MSNEQIQFTPLCAGDRARRFHVQNAMAAVVLFVASSVGMIVLSHVLGNVRFSNLPQIF